MKYFISGANGQLGKELKEISENSKHKFTFFGRELDISDKENLNNYFKENNDYNFFINCAAYTNVDKAESEKEEAYKINADSLKNIVELSNKYGFTLIHISTDFVFDGKKDSPYTEKDIENPISIYGKSKLSGENIITENCKDYLIIRTSWVYSKYGQNFVKKIIELCQSHKVVNVVSDQFASPTHAKDLAEALVTITERLNDGKSTIESKLYNYVNFGKVSKYDFAEKIIEYANLDCKIHPVGFDYFDLPAKRPRYSVLDTMEISKIFSIHIKPWDIALRECVSRILDES